MFRPGYRNSFIHSFVGKGEQIFCNQDVWYNRHLWILHEESWFDDFRYVINVITIRNLEHMTQSENRAYSRLLICWWHPFKSCPRTCFVTMGVVSQLSHIRRLKAVYMFRNCKRFIRLETRGKELNGRCP